MTATQITLTLVVAGFVIGVVAESMARRFLIWWRNQRKPPWARVRSVVTWGDQAGYSKAQVLGVSRHHIAESGLVCPVCSETAAERADFSCVERMMVNGVENEVIECRGRRTVENDRDIACGTFLAASPDTEHGDHLNEFGEVVVDGEADRPEFFRFVRMSKSKALREKYGDDVSSETTEDGEEALSVEAPPVEAEPVALPKTNKHDVLSGEELQKAISRAIDEENARKALTIDPKMAETQKLAAINPTNL